MRGLTPGELVDSKVILTAFILPVQELLAASFKHLGRCLSSTEACFVLLLLCAIDSNRTRED